nr:CDP-glycerol glycerophosphotransferase family protein [uncultured Schaedlerella sp.]
MRKAKKAEILEILESLGRAHEEIKEELYRYDGFLVPNFQRAQKMLNECQEFAISLGKSIEKLEGEGHITVGCIESYCETIYEIYMEIDNANGREIHKNNILKHLKKQLITIENSVKNDIIVRKEVVFLPYKASMWDSMESVWMKARDDENSDAYVIAIPYFERNRDHSLGKMHYEGDKYPKDVPITDWQKYRIEEQRPDIIYFQNPYDDCNYVTCVHPYYFSRELKKHTDMLIYLPYFVGTNNYVGEHLCTTPGVMNADKVIVQSEAVKRIYIESIQKFEKENQCKGRFGDLDKKILPLGSPKLDRIKRIIHSGKAEIPEEWKDKIYRLDGTKKQMIFYNTTIDALLKHSETYMDKLKRVLTLFRNEKEFVLLWRPHPLLETTIKSMRPDLYREYMQIVENYQEEGWGIYDETADIDRAIVISDAYYGDWSSVVEMYKLTEKPIMIQNCEV